jgi:hypothetical protein
MVWRKSPGDDRSAAERIVPDRPLALHGRDRVHRDGGAQFAGGHLGEPEVADLARAHQFGHRADGFLDRHGQVPPVQVIQVNDVGSAWR